MRPYLVLHRHQIFVLTKTMRPSYHQSPLIPLMPRPAYDLQTIVHFPSLRYNYHAIHQSYLYLHHQPAPLLHLVQRHLVLQLTPDSSYCTLESSKHIPANIHQFPNVPNTSARIYLHTHLQILTIYHFHIR